ncbi:hypothetical protein [Bradyrhizobium quebecense]|uniref:Uncharacterized protein n=2 Tax=Bradyrhizobium quebecense TaxID=2748629 RepID=A0ACD3VAQ5_9BRAD|nr:hypothetical protein [Bradyrhizobium quebecense]UGY03272.1 hypothetical protein J4P68_0000370 [Bradyrhizobium quebecense]
MDTYTQINAERIASAEDFRESFGRKVARMTLAEVDAELPRWPSSPEDDRDVIARALLMQRRHDFVAADIDRRAREAAAHAVEEPGLVDVVIPAELGATAIASRDRPGAFYYPELRAGRYVARMPWGAFHALAMSMSGSAGPSGIAVNGAAWLEANPALAARLPRNAPPPVAG